MSDRSGLMRLPGPEAAEDFGRTLAQALTSRAGALRRRGLMIGLSGPLGAGKTTVVRALLRALGVEGAVRSPTYTLIEPYSVALGEVRHLDLYRLGDPGELEFLGAEDLRAEAALNLIEWPEQGGRLFDELDLLISLDYHPDGGRRLALQAHSEAGRHLLEALPGAD